jgi:hypothetical protein
LKVANVDALLAGISMGQFQEWLSFLRLKNRLENGAQEEKAGEAGEDPNRKVIELFARMRK